MVAILNVVPDDDLVGNWQLTSPTPVEASAYVEPTLVGSAVAGYVAGDALAAADIADALTLPSVGAVGGGTIQLIGTTPYDGSASSSTTHNMTLPSVTILENDLIEIVTHVMNSTAQTTGSTASGYLERHFEQAASGFNPSTTKLYDFAAGGESGTVAVTLPESNRMVGFVRVWRGVDTTTPYDFVAGSIGTAEDEVDPDPVAVTTVTNNAMVVVDIGVKDNSGPGAPTAPSGYSLDGDVGGSNRSAAFFSNQVDTAGVENPGSVTWGVEDSQALTDALRPAASSGDLTLIVAVSAVDETTTAELSSDPPVLSGATWTLETSPEVPRSDTYRPMSHVWSAPVSSYTVGDEIDITVADHDDLISWVAVLLIFSGCDSTDPIELIGTEDTGASTSATFGSVTPTTLGAKVVAMMAKAASGNTYSASAEHDGSAPSPIDPVGLIALAESVSDSMTMTAWMTPPLISGAAVSPPQATWEGLEDWVTFLLCLKPAAAAASATDLYAVVDSSNESTWVDIASAAGSMDEVLELDLAGLPVDSVVTSIDVTVKHQSESGNPLRVELVAINADDTIVNGGEHQVGYRPNRDGSVTEITTGAWSEMANGTDLFDYSRFGVRLFSTERVPGMTSHRIFSVSAVIGYEPGGPAVSSVAGPTDAGDPITWVYSSAAGLPQVAYEVMVIEGSSQDPVTATVAANPLDANTGEIIYRSGMIRDVLARSLSIATAPLGRGGCTVGVRAWARLSGGQEVSSDWDTANFNISGTEPTTPDQSGNTNPTLSTSSGAVEVTVDVPAAVSRAWLLRSNDSGVTYELTEGSPFEVTASATDVVLSDYYAPLASDTVRYKVAFDNGAMSETSDPGVAGSTDVDRSTTITDWWAIVPSAPSINQALDVFRFDRIRGRATTTVRQAGNNLVVSSARLGDSFEMTLRTKDAAERAAVESLLDQGAWRMVDILGRSWFVAVVGDENPQLQRWRPLDTESTGLRDGHVISFDLVEIGSL